MKIYIAYKKRKGPWGGGNQFLTLLESEFRKKDFFTSNIKDADMILINSFTDIDLIIKSLLNSNKIPIVHRVDGPIYNYRSDKISGFLDDFIVILISNFITDGTIFQSKYSFNQLSKFLKKNKINNKSRIISNTAKEIFFNNFNKIYNFQTNKLRVIASSWSTNKFKCLEYIKKIDNELDFSKFEFTFIGNIDYKFRNIKHIKALPNDRIPSFFKNQNVYYSPSKYECCSNAICEALASGLPVIAHNSGGNSDLIKKGGILFDDFKGSILALETIRLNYSKYTQQISINTPKRAAELYLEFFKEIKSNYVFNRLKRIQILIIISIIIFYIFLKKSYNLIIKLFRGTKF